MAEIKRQNCVVAAGKVEVRQKMNAARWRWQAQEVRLCPIYVGPTGGQRPGGPTYVTSVWNVTVCCAVVFC